MRTILKAENLEKVYRVGRVDVPALRGVSLDVQEGEFLAIMGPSGCGKSTMLHLLGGLLTPTAGRIIIDDEDLTAATDARRTDIRRRKIGFIFQRFNLFPTRATCAWPNAFTAATARTIPNGDVKFCACFDSKTRCITSRWSFPAASSNGWRLRAPSSHAPP
jgi:ABC-type sulfate/molybdate transport systems ATPase subunit